MKFGWMFWVQRLFVELCGRAITNGNRFSAGSPARPTVLAVGTGGGCFNTVDYRYLEVEGIL